MTQNYHNVQTTVIFVFLASGYKKNAEIDQNLEFL